MMLMEERVDVIDLPGTYSLQTSDESELAAVQYLLDANKHSVIVNIIDATVLSRSLELTLQLMELGRPMVIGLNMIDEAEQKGILIYKDALVKALGIPVIETIGRTGEGIYRLFKQAQSEGKKGSRPRIIHGPANFERAVTKLVNILAKKKIKLRWDLRFLAQKLLEKDEIINKYLLRYLNSNDHDAIQQAVQSLEQDFHRGSDLIISSVRHNMAFSIFEEVANVGEPPQRDFRKKIDDFLMHPLWGFVAMVMIFYLTFTLIFTIGGLIEPIFIDNFEKLKSGVAAFAKGSPLLLAVLNGIVQGIGGGIGIVIPFLLPFFVILSLFEDTGYLARVAYLIDNIMHRIGLHGMSAIPILLSYGCTVPGILATRILKSPRDKFITATLATLVPCSARMTIIFGLVGFFISMKAAIVIYLLNLAIIGLTGKVMSTLMPEITPGLLMEIPRYHAPKGKVVMAKTWLRLKDFVVVAWPLLIAGSIILEFISHLHLTDSINRFLSPFTSGILGLPAALGITLVFGIMRKELALVLLFAALGTNDVLKVLTPTQVYGFTIFVTFYIPCLATIAVLAKELSWKRALLVTLMTVSLAIGLAVLVRFLFPLFA
jgi:ferrous iron transport protein B